MRVLILLTTLLLSSCAITDLLPVSKGVEANINAGKNVEQNKSVANIEQGATKQTADKISNDNHYVADKVEQSINAMPWWVVLIIIMLAGRANIRPFKMMGNGIKWVIGLFKK